MSTSDYLDILHVVGNIHIQYMFNDIINTQRFTFYRDDDDRLYTVRLLMRLDINQFTRLLFISGLDYYVYNTRTVRIYFNGTNDFDRYLRNVFSIMFCISYSDILYDREVVEMFFDGKKYKITNK